MLFFRNYGIHIPTSELDQHFHAAFHLCCIFYERKVGDENAMKLIDKGGEWESKNTVEGDLSPPIISSNDTPKIIDGLVNLSHTNMFSSLLQSNVPEEKLLACRLFLWCAINHLPVEGK